MRVASRTALGEQRGASSERVGAPSSTRAQMPDEHVRLKSYLNQRDGDDSYTPVSDRSNNRKETEMKQRQKLKLL